MLDTSTELDRKLRSVSIRAMAAGAEAWRRLRVDDLGGSWTGAVVELEPQIVRLQAEAAGLALAGTASTIAEQGFYEPPAAFAVPAAFAGTAADGRSLAGLLYSPAATTKKAIGVGYNTVDAVNMGRSSLQMMLKTTIADTARAAASVDITVRKGTGYTRMLTPPSCSRCIILAGRFYRWNEGFRRHPRCDCRHIPTRENIAGDTTTDPYEAFNSYSKEDQDRYFGAASAQAIRDGADISQVVNARTRGMDVTGLTTTEGTGRRGNFRRTSTEGVRLTPQAIYERNAGDRAGAIRDLERYGYILPGGQVPGGSLRGQREGFGTLGRGGTRVGARNAVEEARRTGVRDSNVRATMTAAERRRSDAQANWDNVRAGRNPYRTGKPLSPALAAAVENDYRQIVLENNSAVQLTARRSL